VQNSISKRKGGVVMMRSGNPALRDSVFTSAVPTSDGRVMTIQGTVNKTMILLLLVSVSASWMWGLGPRALAYIFPALILGLVAAMVTIFKKEIAYITAPIYALIQGVVLGGISSVFEAQYPGIVVQAVALTFGTLFCLLMAYKSGLIKATEKFRLGVVAATGAIAVIYLVSIVMGFFGAAMPMIHSTGPMGILFSLFVVTIAALNLVLDFDFIERGADANAPGYMEWYAAFGLIVTLIWLYMEILRLLSKLQRR
jgi:uncharacterized YccA/Bax inhibitor family protein